MEKRLERLLRRLGVYAPMKSTILYETYLRTFRRDVLRARDREIDFYRKMLSEAEHDGPIFDVGANLGDKAEVFRRLPARVVCFEPDRTNVRFLNQRFRKWKDVVVVGSALSDRIGPLNFNVFEEGDALNTVSDKWVEVLTRERDPRLGAAKRVATRYPVEGLTLDRAIDRYGLAAYVKIDVEGHEINVLKGLSRPVPLVSFEVNLPEFRREAIACVNRLDAINPGVMFNYDVHCRLEMAEWRSASAFASWLEKVDLPYMEVWCRNARPNELPVARSRPLAGASQDAVSTT